MIELGESGERRRVPVSPALAVRVALMGGLALVLFAVVFFRLWYLQVLTGDQYRAQANTNQVRRLPIAAPRGEILDRDGRVLVRDRITNAVQIVPTELPASRAGRLVVYRRLAGVLGTTARRINQLVDADRVALPYADVTVKVDTGYGALAYLEEHQQQFPGVRQRQISIREYPFHDMAAQLLGYVGVLNAADLKQKRYRGAPSGSIVGQSGVEAAYDRYLRGHDGVQRVAVNAGGQAQGALPETAALAGHDLRLTIDRKLQLEGEKALQQGMGLAHANGNAAGAGAFVALDPRNGQVLAMGSSPSFDPNQFARPLTQAQYDALQGTSTQADPLVNRAVNGLYPTGSTFKPITAMAGLMSGLITPGTSQGAGSCVTIALEPFCNAGHTDYGDLDLQNALRVSEDTYFYLLGAQANNVQGEVIQTMARRLGLGRPTAIDLPGETTGGVVPDRAWRARQNAIEIGCEHRRHRPSCGIANGAPWTIGDNVQLATGQGDLLATPLQMAVVYSTLADAYAAGTGETTVPVPHLAEQIDDSSGRLVSLVTPPAGRQVHLDYGDLSTVMAGLHDATSQPGGTSADVWKGFPRPVYGKTGTAQHGAGQSDQSWYLCYVPDRTRPIVMAVTIEKGGFGDQAAAPVARLLASEWFGLPEKLVQGSNTTR